MNQLREALLHKRHRVPLTGEILVRDKTGIKVTRVEERERDSWYDLSLRSLREGIVRFYRVEDLLTGKWLFKVCHDEEHHKNLVKAVKCPPGTLYSQLEGNTMVFQESTVEGFFYDIISLTYLGENSRVRRKPLRTLDEVPRTILNLFVVKTYEEGVGRKPIRRYVVTLTEEGDEKSMIKLFILERAWPLLPINLDLAFKTQNVLETIKELERADLEEIYRAVNEGLGVERGDLNAILELFEARGIIQSPEFGFIKTR